MRKAFVFNDSSWDCNLAKKYSEWVNTLLEKYPNAKFEFHQNISGFHWDREEVQWIEILTLVIVTDDTAEAYAPTLEEEKSSPSVFNADRERINAPYITA
jgi:hypothetical protein